jgi:hypothetical protein
MSDFSRPTIDLRRLTIDPTAPTIVREARPILSSGPPNDADAARPPRDGRRRM